MWVAIWSPQAREPPTPAWVGDVVRALVLDEVRLAGMAAAAASVGERGGDELRADLVVAAARGHRP